MQSAILIKFKHHCQIHDAKLLLNLYVAQISAESAVFILSPCWTIRSTRMNSVVGICFEYFVQIFQNLQEDLIVTGLKHYKSNYPQPTLQLGLLTANSAIDQILGLVGGRGTPSLCGAEGVVSSTPAGVTTHGGLW